MDSHATTENLGDTGRRDLHTSGRRFDTVRAHFSSRVSSWTTKAGDGGMTMGGPDYSDPPICVFSRSVVRTLDGLLRGRHGRGEHAAAGVDRLLGRSQ